MQHSGVNIIYFTSVSDVSTNVSIQYCLSSYSPEHLHICSINLLVCFVRHSYIFDLAKIPLYCLNNQILWLLLTFIHLPLPQQPLILRVLQVTIFECDFLLDSHSVCLKYNNKFIYFRLFLSTNNKQMQVKQWCKKDIRCL